jgi:hypothetical protein
MPPHGPVWWPVGESETRCGASLGFLQSDITGLNLALRSREYDKEDKQGDEQRWPKRA